jgi:hypothetical protein
MLQRGSIATVKPLNGKECCLSGRIDARRNADGRQHKGETGYSVSLSSVWTE